MSSFLLFFYELFLDRMTSGNHLMKSTFFLVCSLFLFVLSSCGGGNLSSKVSVRVARYGSDRLLSPNKRITLYSKSVTGKEICRRYPFTIRQARESLKKSALDEEVLDNFFEDIEEGQGQNLNERNEPVRTDVSENWLKFGLKIYNANGGELREEDKNSVYLVVTALEYVAIANHRGQEYSHSGTINTSYCDNIPFLYFLPPSSRITYNPISKDPFRNLTIIISGFPIIDRSREPSYNLLQRIQNVSRQFDTQNSGQRAGANQQGGSGQNQFGPNEDPIIIPDYTVEFILTGYFMTKSGDIVADFASKKIRFPTQSSFHF